MRQLTKQPALSFSCLCLCLLLVCSSRVSALTPDKALTQYVHSSWQNVHGLPQNTVNSFAQTEDGYLWMGTLEGLVRFDGARFTVFNTRNHPEFAHNFVVSLLVDSQNRLWISTSGGGLLKMQDQQFTRYTTQDGLPSDHISIVFEDSRGKIWIGTDGEGLASTSDGETFVRAAVDVPGSSISAITESRTGLWIGTDGGLLLLRKDGSEILFTQADGLSDSSIRALFSDNTGALWVSTDRGLDKLEHGLFTPINLNASPGDDTVMAMLQDRDGELWFATDGGGLKRRDKDGFSSFTSQFGLSNDTVLALYETTDGSLWIGTNLGGLNRLKDGPISTYTTREGLSHNFIRAVYEDSTKTLWIGSEGGGLMQYRDGHFQAFTTSDGLPDNSVYSILEDASGDLWVGTGNGLARRTGNTFEVMDESSGLASGTILTLLEDSAGTLWAGTWRSGLVRYKDGVFSSITTEHGLANNTINALLEDSEGRLWIGTRGGGISRLTNGKLETFTTADGLSDDLVFAFFEDDTGSLWIGTYGGGINRYKDGKFSAVTEAQGLFDDVIHRIIDDGRGNFWMSSNRGIFSVAKIELDMAADGTLDMVNPVVFGINDGMKNVECNGGGNAGILGSDGALWFPSVAGLLRVAPDAIEASGPPLKLLIEELRVGGSPLADANKLNLPAGTNNLEIHYTAVDLHSPEKLIFRYRMQNYDKDWINAGSRRTAYYSQLPAGRYRFQVQAGYGPNLSAMQEVSAELRVAPRWYETGWFRGMLLLALLFIAYALYRLRTSQVSRRTLQLEREVSERTAALETANQQLKQLSIEDGLTGLLNRRAFDALLQDECRRAERAKIPLALMMLDIDYFKQFNDIYGHQAGDACLILVADTLKKACGRAGEFVARYGGEELAIILPATSPEYALQQAENLRCKLLELAIPHSGSDAAKVVTVSIGVTSLVPVSGQSPSVLVSAADKALYSAKAAGRNRVEFTEVD